MCLLLHCALWIGWGVQRWEKRRHLGMTDYAVTSPIPAPKVKATAVGTSIIQPHEVGFEHYGQIPTRKRCS